MSTVCGKFYARTYLVFARVMLFSCCLYWPMSNVNDYLCGMFDHETVIVFAIVMAKNFFLGCLGCSIYWPINSLIGGT